MKRLHIHISVNNLDEAIRFYNTLFDQKASVVKNDYAKWLLDDPAINFAISNHGDQQGLNHLGFQVDSENDLQALSQRLAQADIGLMPELDAQCCYAHSDKYWTKDPAGIPWENFRNLGETKTFHGTPANTGSPDPGQVNNEDEKATHCCN